MNSSTVQQKTLPDPDQVLDDLARKLQDLTPELRKAATYVMENPLDVSVSTIREIANSARVKPNSFVRMARSVGFEGYEDFRQPFRQHIRNGYKNFTDRARWLQSLHEGGELTGLYGNMVAGALHNLEETFAGIDANDLKAAAEAVWASRQTFVLGVGVNNANAANFAYLANTAMNSIIAIPRQGSVAVDDLARANGSDVLIAMTCKPFRSEVVEAVAVAREQGVTIIGISDSPASPVVVGSQHSFIVASDAPQFFPSSIATIAILETLLSFVIASASKDVVARVEKFHQRRHQLGIYYSEE